VSWIPGWSTVAGTAWWSGFYFWISICALIALGVAEVASHRYSDRKDELAAIEQDAIQQHHDEEMAGLHLEASKADERAADANLKATELQADNLALQTAMLPRHVGSIGLNEPPKAREWFAGMEAFAGTEFIVVPADDAEARNLANEIVVVLRLFGCTAAHIDSNRTTGQFPDGVSVSYPMGRAWTQDQPNQPWFEWAKAAEMLANSLTKAGLAIGDRQVSRYGFTPVAAGATTQFLPVRDGVLVIVGPRPITETIEWIKAGRPDVNGVKAADRRRQTPK
jgi:hypothetical protein